MTLRVPFVDLRRQHAALAPELERAFARVLVSSQFVLGPEVERFEALAAEYVGARHGIGVSSGTDALWVALTALGVGPGDEVITTPFTFVATVEAILRAGARPRFVDVESKTLNLDVTQVADAVSSRTRAVLPVHLFGSTASLTSLLEHAARRGVMVLEDAAQAFGSRYEGRGVGTWGAAGCFSFFPAKVLGALGDAGLIVTDDGALAGRCRRLRQHGTDRMGLHTEVGGNSRLDAIQAAVLSVKLAHVDGWIRARRANVKAYDAAFHKVDGLAPVEHAAGSNGAVYTLRVRDGRREGLRTHLRRRGIETAIYYGQPLHLQPLLEFLRLERGSFPESERAASEVLSLPVFPELTSGERDSVIEAVLDFFAGSPAD